MGRRSGMRPHGLGFNFRLELDLQQTVHFVALQDRLHGRLERRGFSELPLPPAARRGQGAQIAFGMRQALVSSKGSVVIPAELRRKYDLRPGAKVLVVDDGGVLAVVPAFERRVEEAAGMLKGGPSLAKAAQKLLMV